MLYDSRNDKEVNKCFLYLILFMIGMKLKKSVRVISENPSLIVYCPDHVLINIYIYIYIYIYISQRKC